MNLLSDPWLRVRDAAGKIHQVSPLQMGDAQYCDVVSDRPDFQGAVYQLLIGLLQLVYAPADKQEWKERWAAPPDVQALGAAVAPILSAFELEAEGPAFMQDANLPPDANQLPVLDLLIDAGSDSNLFFNKPTGQGGMCEACVAQAVFTLQINAPSGGRGIRTSLRGGGPMTTLLVPQKENASLWQRLWLNVLTRDTLGHDPVTAWGSVLPWLVPTRTSDGAGALDTTPDTVHPLQAYWSMPRRIRLDAATVTQGDCAICGSRDVRLFQHYRTRHGGTNYTGAWVHPLTPYSLDPKHQAPPLSIKGQPGGIGYRHWLGLTFGKPDQQPQAAGVVSHYHTKIRAGTVLLWCFGYDMNNMKARCWYDSTLPVHVIDEADQRHFIRWVGEWTNVASEAASALHYRVKSAWFKRPGDTGSEPAIHQSFWQGSEPGFYAALQALARSDLHDPAVCAALSKRWLAHVSQTTLNLFEHWTLAGPVEERDLARVVRARAALVKDLKAGKAAKSLWNSISSHLTEKA